MIQNNKCADKPSAINYARRAIIFARCAIISARLCNNKLIPIIIIVRMVHNLFFDRSKAYYSYGYPFCRIVDKKMHRKVLLDHCIPVIFLEIFFRGGVKILRGCFSSTTTVRRQN